MKLWDSMLKKGLDPDTVAYNFLIYGCCVAGKLAKAFELHDEMMRRGMKPNWATYYALSRRTCLKGSGFHEPRGIHPPVCEKVRVHLNGWGKNGEPEGEICRGDNPNSATRSITWGARKIIPKKGMIVGFFDNETDS